VSTRKVHAVRQAVATCIPGWRWTTSTQQGASRLTDHPRRLFWVTGRKSHVEQIWSAPAQTTDMATAVTTFSIGPEGDIVSARCYVNGPQPVDRAMHNETWWEGPLCVTHPINGRRIIGICEDGQWRWTVRINGPRWQEERISILFDAGYTVEAARQLATELGPKRDQDESVLASELHRQIEGRP
jgi:hypothetical protein